MIYSNIAEWPVRCPVMRHKRIPRGGLPAGFVSNRKMQRIVLLLNRATVDKVDALSLRFPIDECTAQVHVGHLDRLTYEQPFPHRWRRVHVSVVIIFAHGQLFGVRSTLIAVWSVLGGRDFFV